MNNRNDRALQRAADEAATNRAPDLGLTTRIEAVGTLKECSEGFRHSIQKYKVTKIHDKLYIDKLKEAVRMDLTVFKEQCAMTLASCGELNSYTVEAMIARARGVREGILSTLTDEAQEFIQDLRTNAGDKFDERLAALEEKYSSQVSPARTKIRNDTIQDTIELYNTNIAAMLDRYERYVEEVARGRARRK